VSSIMMMLTIELAGYLCRWAHTTPDGCCDLTMASVADRFSCDYCNATSNCCMIYEYCVSCCVGPEKRELVMQTLNVTNNLLYRATSSLFDFCRARCRTSSSSMIAHKQFSTAEKHCFGPEPQANDADSEGNPKNNNKYYNDNGGVSRSVLHDGDTYASQFDGLLAVIDDIPSDHWSYRVNAGARLSSAFSSWLLPLVLLLALLFHSLPFDTISSQHQDDGDNDAVLQRGTSSTHRKNE